MNQVIVFPRGQLNDIDRQSLQDGGFIAVEADDPKAVVVHVPGVPLASGDDLLMAAMAGVGAGPGQSLNSFTTELHKRLKANEAKKNGGV